MELARRGGGITKREIGRYGDGNGDREKREVVIGGRGGDGVREKREMEIAKSGEEKGNGDKEGGWLEKGG